MFVLVCVCVCEMKVSQSIQGTLFHSIVLLFFFLETGFQWMCMCSSLSSPAHQWTPGNYSLPSIPSTELLMQANALCFNLCYGTKLWSSCLCRRKPGISLPPSIPKWHLFYFKILYVSCPASMYICAAYTWLFFTDVDILKQMIVKHHVSRD